MFLKLLEQVGASGNELDHENGMGEANFYRRRRNHLKRDKNNLDGRIKPSFIRIYIEDENEQINPKTIEYAKKYGIDILVVVQSKYREGIMVDKDGQER